MNFGSIAPDEVKVGEQYQFESKYHWCVHAIVLENQLHYMNIQRDTSLDNL